MSELFNDPSPTKLSEMRDINRRLQSVADEAPSDSTVELEVIRDRVGGYKALLKIYSMHARFVGASRSGKFSDVIDKIFSEVRSQIERWKGEREMDRLT